VNFLGLSDDWMLDLMWLVIVLVSIGLLLFSLRKSK
jgi:hypothetical protein